MGTGKYYINYNGVKTDITDLCASDKGPTSAYAIGSFRFYDYSSPNDRLSVEVAKYLDPWNKGIELSDKYDDILNNSHLYKALVRGYCPRRCRMIFSSEGYQLKMHSNYPEPQWEALDYTAAHTDDRRDTHWVDYYFLEYDHNNEKLIFGEARRDDTHEGVIRPYKTYESMGKEFFYDNEIPHRLFIRACGQGGGGAGNISGPGGGGAASVRAILNLDWLFERQYNIFIFPTYTWSTDGKGGVNGSSGNDGCDFTIYKNNYATTSGLGTLILRCPGGKGGSSSGTPGAGGSASNVSYSTSDIFLLATASGKSGSRSGSNAEHNMLDRAPVTFDSFRLTYVGYRDISVTSRGGTTQPNNGGGGGGAGSLNDIIPNTYQTVANISILSEGGQGGSGIWGSHQHGYDGTCGAGGGGRGHNNSTSGDPKGGNGGNMYFSIWY